MQDEIVSAENRALENGEAQIDTDNILEEVFKRKSKHLLGKGLGYQPIKKSKGLNYASGDHESSRALKNQVEQLTAMVLKLQEDLAASQQNGFRTSSE